MDDFTLKVSFLAGLLVVVSLFVSRYFGLTGNPMLDAIPTVGFSDPILSYLSAVQFTFDGARMLKKGYEKSRPGLFKIANYRSWMVLVTGSELIDDIRRAPDEVLSRAEPINGIIQPEYTMGSPNTSDPYFTNVVRSKLTRDTALTFKEIREELIMAMEDVIPAHEHKWLKVPIQATLQRVICRTTNRIVVGVPLCRDHGYQTLSLTWAVNVVKIGFIISLFPRPLKLIVSRILSNLPSQIQQQADYIRPMVEERSAKMDEYGEEWDDKPNDLLMWLMCEAKMSAEDLARRLFLVNLAGLHTTSATTTQALYRLLTNPEYIEPLRQEVDRVIREEGWTKEGIDKMHKIDSFLRESQRLGGVSSVAMARLALHPFTFSNGVTIPAGTYVSIPSSALQTDERIYPNPDIFDGFRFAKLRESEGDTTGRHQAAFACNEHLPFGVGRHTCPGRFFAVNEIKAMFAYMVVTYDIKFEDGKPIPRDHTIAELRFPGDANVMFRARQK